MSERPIEVEGPGGVIVEFPAGTSMDVMRGAMQRRFGGPAPATTLADFRRQYPQYSDMSDRQLADGLYRRFYSDMPRADFDRRIGFQPQTWTDLAGDVATTVGRAAERLNPVGQLRQALAGYTGFERQLLQGATFSTADEIEASARALAGADYDTTVTDIRRGNEAFARDNPATALAANVAGGVVPFVAGPGMAAARWGIGSTLPRTIGRSAVVGAGVGGLSGLGAGEGDIAERLPSAGHGAAVGFGLGAAAPPVIAGAARGLGWAWGRLAPPETTARLGRWFRGEQSPPPPVPPQTGRPPPIEGATFTADGATPSAGALDAQSSALRIMADQLLRGGHSVADVERAILAAQQNRRFHSAGAAQEVLTLADVMPEWQRLAGSIGRQYPEAAADMGAFMTARQTGHTPPGASAARLAERGLPTREPFSPPLTGRQAEQTLGGTFSTSAGGNVPMGQLERIRDSLRRAFRISDADYHGHAGSGLRTVESIVQRAEQQAQAAYGTAYKAAENVDLRSVVQAVFRRHIERAALEESPQLERYLIKIQNDLFVRPRRSIVLRQFDNSKRQLDGLIKDDLSKPKYVHRGGVLTALQRDLLEAVDNATGGANSLYRAARAEFADEMSAANAYLSGRRALDDVTRLRRTGPGREVSGPEVTADTFRALSKGQQKLFRFGLLDAVTAKGKGQPLTHDQLRIFSTPRVQELLNVAIERTTRRGAEFSDRPQRFGRWLAGERAMLETAHVTRGNSMTARNLADDASLQGLEAVQQVKGFMDLLRGSTSAWDFGQRLLQQSIDRAFGLNADAAAEVARMLFTANPAEREAILRRLAGIMPANRMARFNELMGQAQRYLVTPGAGAVGGMAAPPSGTPTFL